MAPGKPLMPPSLVSTSVKGETISTLQVCWKDEKQRVVPLRTGSGTQVALMNSTPCVFIVFFPFALFVHSTSIDTTPKRILKMKSASDSKLENVIGLEFDKMLFNKVFFLSP